ncbi:MAG TPA: 50S ribosomal protein L10 [Patescibacteria group bacterium]|nr:50S ribosomal protein L10 [Patescibacteria group bacterium]
MAKTRAQKEQMIADLTEKFGNTKSVVFTQFSAVTVSDMEAMRQQARDEGVQVVVAKKSLMGLAAKEAGVSDLEASELPNSVVTLFGMDDEVSAAKLAADFAKKHEEAHIVGGVFEGAFASADQMIALSKVPSKQELYAKLVGSINAPVSGFVNVLAGNLRGLVTTLKAVQEQKA